MNSRKTILVIGAGLGGLTVAIALAQRGFNVRVHEQTRVLGELGAGLTLPGTAMKVFDHLGLWNEVRDITTRVGAMAFVHYQTLDMLHGGHDQDWLHKPDKPEQGGHAHRAALHAVLVKTLQEAAPGALSLGHRLAGFSQDADKVRVTFENGDVDEGDLMIAADGVRSAAFRALFGHDNGATFTGSIAIRCMVPRTAAIEPYLTGGRAMNFIGPGRNFARYGVRDGTLINCVGLARTDAWTFEGWSHPCPREEVLAIFDGFHRDVIGLIENAPAETIFKWALYDREPLANWTVGRAILLGDAAHPMLPYLGQGATAAIEDGLVLARALEAHDRYEDAFASYQANRILRTTEQMRASTRQGEALDRGPDHYNAIRPSQTLLASYDPVTAPV